MKIAIVEDDKESAAILMKYIDRYQKENGGGFEVKHFFSGLEFMSTEEIYDLVFMDISMPHINGMVTARELRKNNRVSSIIFVTSLAQYAVEGYEVDALDFILKPVEYYTFSLKIKKAIRIYEKNRSHCLSVPTEEGFACMNVDEVIYVEVSGHSLYFHTADTVVESRKGALKNYEQKLASFGFFRVNYYCLVNLKYVARCTGDILSVAGQELKISKSRKKEFMRALTDYLNET